MLRKLFTRMSLMLMHDVDGNCVKPGVEQAIQTHGNM